MGDRAKQPTCAERVAEHLASRLKDLKRFPELGGGHDSVDTLYATPKGPLCDECVDDDTDLEEHDERPAQCSECGKDWPDEDGAVDDLGSFNEYGLSFDYVEAGTFTDQDEGYARFQMSCGGPADEFRFYIGPGFELYRAEYWFLDWFDGASRNVTNDETVQAVYELFNEVGSVEHAYHEATD